MTGRTRKVVRFGEHGANETSTRQVQSSKGILKPPKPVGAAPQSLISRLFAGAVDVPSRGITEIFELVKDTIIQGNYRVNQYDDNVSDTPSVLEAYTLLNACLKSREGTAEVAGDVRRIVQAIKRDFLVFEKTTDVLEVRVVVQIFRVIDGLLSSEATASVIEAEYVRFFLGHAIEILGQQDSSKALIGVCIHLFTNLYFPKALSSDLASRLLIAMGGRPSFPSAGLAAEYLTAYRMMLSHHRKMMVEHTECWVETLVHSLCENNAFVRQQALLTLAETNRKLACEDSVSKAMLGSFQNVDAEGEPFGSLICHKLSAFLSSQGDARTIMSIWSNVLLALSANSEEKVRNWPTLGKWLEVCKHGLNSVYLSTKEASLLAWRTAICIFAFDSRPEHFERNLQPLTYPFKLIRGNTPSVIIKRHLSLLNALLFIGLRTQTPTPALYEVIWTKIVTPAMQCLFASNSTEARTEAINILTFLLRNGQFSSPGPTPLRSRVIGSDVELAEVGGFPAWWVKQNSHMICGLIAQLRELTSTNDVLGLWQMVASICKQSLSSEIHESAESVNQVANMLTFLHKVPAAEMLSFVMSMVDTIGVASLMSKKFTVNEDEVMVASKFQSVQATSGIAIITKLILIRADQKDAESAFVRILNQSGTFRRALNILNLAVSLKYTSEFWEVCADQVRQQLCSQPGDLAGDDLDNVLSILSAGPSMGLKETAWQMWSELFVLALKSHGYNEPFVTLLSRLEVHQLDNSTLLRLKSGTLCNRNEFNAAIVRALISRPESFSKLAMELQATPASFRVLFSRQLVAASYNSTLYDFEEILSLTAKLIEEDELIDNADIFVMGLRSSIEAHKQLAASMWNTLFENVSANAQFSDTVVATINNAYAGQGFDIILPPSIPLLSSSFGHQSPSRKHLMFPSSSPPQSPTEDLVSVKRRRIMAQHVEHGDLVTPPPSSDNTSGYSIGAPGARAMDLFRKLHETSDPLEIENIKEEQGQMLKPRPIPLLSEMEDLCSSPPRLNNDDSRERTKEIRILKSALMRSDLRRNLKKGVSKSECQLLEKLLMDSLVSVRIHMATQSE